MKELKFKDTQKSTSRRKCYVLESRGGLSRLLSLCGVDLAVADDVELVVDEQFLAV